MAGRKFGWEERGREEIYFCGSKLEFEALAIATW
jgi:hypothetical protein